jgi:hypothetical protein
MVELIETESLAWWFLLAALANLVAAVALRGSPWGVIP